MILHLRIGARYHYAETWPAIRDLITLGVDEQRFSLPGVGAGDNVVFMFAERRHTATTRGWWPDNVLHVSVNSSSGYGGLVWYVSPQRAAQSPDEVPPPVVLGVRQSEPAGLRPTGSFGPRQSAVLRPSQRPPSLAGSSRCGRVLSHRYRWPAGVHPVGPRRDQESVGQLVGMTESLPFEEGPSSWTGPALTADMVRRAEATLGVRLPRAYVELMYQQNGGVLRDGCFPTSFPDVLDG